LVTHHRKSIFKDPKAVDLLTTALGYTMRRLPFEIIAYVILPDHLHYIWTMPQESSDYSTRWRLIKSYFTHHWLADGKISNSKSRVKKGEQDVWQRRFWEHLIRDEKDLNRHVDYIHYNPVKPALVNSPIDWNYSSFIDYMKDGLYPADWGENINMWSGTEYME
jgi:putative transposase